MHNKMYPKEGNKLTSEKSLDYHIQWLLACNLLLLLCMPFKKILTIRFPMVILLQQIGRLLEEMKLTEYVTTFKEESIDGCMLFELDDEVMRDELGMNKKLHRLKILMIVQGTRSVTRYLQDL